MRDTPKIPIDGQFWRGLLAILCVALVAHGLIAFLVFTADLAVRGGERHVGISYPSSKEVLA